MSSQELGTKAAQEQSVIRLAEVDGRTWLITPDGKPFFAHGITHVTNGSLHIRNARRGEMQAGMEDGEIEMVEFVEMLQECGYDGYIAVEYFNGFDEDCVNTRGIREELMALGVEP